MFLRPLDGNACDTQRISQAVTDVLTHVNEALPEEEVRPLVFDNGGSSEATLTRSNEAAGYQRP